MSRYYTTESFCFTPIQKEEDDEKDVERQSLQWGALTIYGETRGAGDYILSTLNSLVSTTCHWAWPSRIWHALGQPNLITVNNVVPHLTGHLVRTPHWTLLPTWERKFFVNVYVRVEIRTKLNGKEVSELEEVKTTNSRRQIHSAYTQKKLQKNQLHVRRNKTCCGCEKQHKKSVSVLSV